MILSEIFIAEMWHLLLLIGSGFVKQYVDLEADEGPMISHCDH